MFVYKFYWHKQKQVNRWIIYALRKGVIRVPTSPCTIFALPLYELNETYEIVKPYNKHVNLMCLLKLLKVEINNKFRNQHNLALIINLVSNYFT